MTEKDPNNWTELLQGLWMIGLGVWGGLVAYYQRYRREGEQFNWAVMFGEIATSALTGLVSFYACKAAGLPDPWIAVVVAISGHAGGELLQMAERLLRKRIYRFLGEPEDEDSRND